MRNKEIAEKIYVIMRNQRGQCFVNIMLIVVILGSALVLYLQGGYKNDTKGINPKPYAPATFRATESIDRETGERVIIMREIKQ